MIILKPDEVDKETVGCIITYNGKYFLLHRTKDDLWGSVAGTIESNETKEDAIKREIRDELGLEITPTFFTTTYHRYGSENVAYHIFEYNFKDNPSNLIKLNFESSESGFFTLFEALKLNLFEDEDYCLNLQNKKK